MTCVLGFIKDQGIKNAKLVLEVIPTAEVEIPDNELGVTYSFKKEELKILVESVDYINKFFEGNIEKASNYLSVLKEVKKTCPDDERHSNCIKIIESHIQNWESIYKENNNEMDA